jgi:outer membrane receptor protein involved in Fe transport
VSQDSAASGSLHVRNEHANVQYRINGIMLPEGVSGFGQFVDSAFVGKLNLLTGALPAQYGLHTSGVIDITSRSGAFDGGGSVSFYGGSRGAFIPSVEYGGTIGDTQYFFTSRLIENNIGIENPTPSVNAIHDHTDQGKFFGYVSTRIDDATRVSFITGSSVAGYQIPNSPGQIPQFTVPDVTNFESAQLNERQVERSFYNVLALQKSLGDVDAQLAYFSRYSSVHYSPDPIGDLIYNGVASNVLRTSLVNGVQGDGALRLNEAHTLRGGFFVSGEQTLASNASTVFPVDADGNQAGDPFKAPVDAVAKFGWQLGAYVQDEWKISDKLTMNAGVRFDQIYQFVDANQFSPRLGFTYKPFEGTAVHAGFARYFTPPSQALSGPTNLALFTGTTLQPSVNLDSAVLPERSSYFDVGVDQKVLPGLTLGVDAYYKVARDLLDDGQFGQALVLTGFNYAKGENEGLELKANYQNGGLTVYGNVAWARQVATNIVSNQFLFDPDELAYIATNYIHTDHAQTVTASAGASYLWQGTRFSADMIYGSGLRSGFANTDHVPAYTQVNVGLSHEFKWLNEAKPTVLRFDVVNLFDSIYEIRDGSGIGVFAPQYGPRRGVFIGISQKL